MARRTRSAFDVSWLPVVAAGQEMDRRIRTRHIQQPVQQPNDVISNEEYPFGHGGVFEVPMSGDENG